MSTDCLDLAECEWRDPEIICTLIGPTVCPLFGTEIGPGRAGLVPFLPQVEEVRTFWMSSPETLIFAFFPFIFSMIALVNIAKLYTIKFEIGFVNYSI